MSKGVKVALACALCLGAALALIYGVKTWLAG